jgi:hypothetical protein
MSVRTRPPRADRLGGTYGNELLTMAAAVLLTALLAAEGVTLLRMDVLRREHMFIGLLLIPPVLLKLGSTGYRFVRYYTGSPRYREKGPPVLGLRLLAPMLVTTTVLLFASGVALMIVGHKSGLLDELHKVSFIVWSACFGVHFLYYLPHVGRTLVERHRPRVAGATARGLLVVAAVGGGLALAVALISVIRAWQSGFFFG